MPEVIVNTSPLQYLFQLSLLELFPSLYGHIIVPEAVVLELNQGRELGCLLPNVEKLAWVTVYPATVFGGGFSQRLLTPFHAALFRADLVSHFRFAFLSDRFGLPGRCG
jgi:hypothetical protein